MFKKIYFEGKETNYSVSEDGQVRNDKFNRIMKALMQEMNIVLFN